MRRFGAQRLLTGLLVMVVAACSGPAASSTPAASASPIPASPTAPAVTVPPTTIPSPSPIPSSTTGPSPIPSTDKTFPELAYVNRFVMRVAVTDLNVRDRPDTSATSNGKAPKGGLFMMYDWPKQADGYTWYYGFTLLTSKPGVLPDLPTPIETGYDEVLGGWMATGTEDNPFLVPLAPRCPATRDLRNVAAMLPYERISCFAADSIELQGAFGCGGCGGVAAGKFEPDWLASVLEFDYLHGTDPEGIPFALHFPPDGQGRPAEGSILKVRGHFSDARSTTCRITELDADGNLTVVIANDAAEQWCRSKFVVESYEVTGTGPVPVG